MRARALYFALLVLLASACGAHITIRSPIRIRFGGPTAAPQPTVLVVLPDTATASVASPAPTTTETATLADPTLTPEATPSLLPAASATSFSSPSATSVPTEIALPTAAEVATPPTPSAPSAAESVTPEPVAPTVTPVNTPPPRLPSVAGAYAVRLLQLRFSAHGEFVQIVNRGPDQDLSGWRLVSAGADSAFTFPDGYVLRQEETVTVHSGTDDVPTEPGHLQWTPERMWRHASEEALLYDAQGELVDRWPRR